MSHNINHVTGNTNNSRGNTTGKIRNSGNTRSRGSSSNNSNTGSEIVVVVSSCCSYKNINCNNITGSSEDSSSLQLLARAFPLAKSDPRDSYLTD